MMKNFLQSFQNNESPGIHKELRSLLNSSLQQFLDVDSQSLDSEITKNHIASLKENFSLETTQDKTHGDLATNIAMLIWGKKQVINFKSQIRSPRDVATQLVTIINQGLKTSTELKKYITKIEVAGPGFINIFLDMSYYFEQLQLVLSDKSKKSELIQGNIIVEFTDPNPFKELHIGHLYSNTVGESISRLLEAAGATVKRVCYQGDVGLHVAKSIWGMREKLSTEMAETSVEAGIERLASLPVKERIAFVGQAYALGATAYEEHPEISETIKKMNFAVFLSAQRMLTETKNWQPQVNYQELAQLDDSFVDEVKKLYIAGRQWSLDYFVQIYDRVGMKFNNFYYESEVGEFGIKIVREFLEKGIFEESQGAIIFPGSKYGLHDRVFINSLGLPTYEAKELGLAPTKYRDFTYDFSIIITGNEINEYFKVLLMALQQTNPELASKTHHMSHGMVRLPDGKMSSRTGKVLTAEWLLNESHQRIATIMDEAQYSRQERGIAQDQSIDREVVAEKVGQAAIKYAFLKQSIGGDIAFSFDESLSFSGQSGPYLQYTYARCQSIFKKAEGILKNAPSENKSAKNTINDYLESLIDIDIHIDTKKEEKQLLIDISRYSDSFKKSVFDLSPHHLALYLFELCQQFNTLYDRLVVVADDWQPLLIAKDKRVDNDIVLSKTDLRLLLTAAVVNLLTKGTHLLGIEVLEKM